MLPRASALTLAEFVCITDPRDPPLPHQGHSKPCIWALQQQPKQRNTTQQQHITANKKGLFRLFLTFSS